MCRFASWTYSSDMVDIKEMYEGHFLALFRHDNACPSVVRSHESRRNVKYYACCPEPYTGIVLNLQLARRQK